MRPAPTNKADFYRRYEAGEFGPTWIQWRDVDHLRDSGYRGPIVLRDRSPSGRTIYGVPATQIIAGDWPGSAAPPGECQLSALLPPEWCVLQGEVSRQPGGLDLFYSVAQKSMKPALRENGEYARGLAAKLMLERHLWPSSLDDVLSLLDTYDGMPVEFTAIDRTLHGWPGRNTIIWEVRNY